MAAMAMALLLLVLVLLRWGGVSPAGVIIIKGNNLGLEFISFVSFVSFRFLLRVSRPHSV